MPPTPTATVSYKKKDGKLTISADGKHLFWSTPDSSTPALTIPIADITNLQATPATSPKIAVKIFVKEESHVFTFSSKDDAREEQEAITEALRPIIAANKAEDAAAHLAPAANPSASTTRDGAGSGQSAAMAIAKAVASKQDDEAWYDDGKLKTDMRLQRSLLEENKTLQSRFNQALKDKPESVSISQFNNQFWSARLHLLRAHAIEKAQRQGEYNVLPEIKFTLLPGEKEGDADIRQLNITKEQIKLLFRQYPVVKEAYDESVPPLDSNVFWTRFFASRLLKKLKGEKITQYDTPDSILDKYLDRGEAGRTNTPHIPHFIDLEGNEQNHSQRKGNRPDQDMRPSSFDKVPILRVLNSLSEKLLSQVAPEDSEAHGPIGMDEETFEQLRLRDLAMEDEDNRVKLNIREPGRPGGDDATDDLSADAKRYAKQDPREVLQALMSEMEPSRLGRDKSGILRLDKAIDYHSDSDDSDDEMDTDVTNGHQSRAINSHSAISAATTSVLTSIKARRNASKPDDTNLSVTRPALFDMLTMTHNTTIEFLHYFWTLFLSGDPTHAAELGQLVSTLDRSLDRLKHVAKLVEDDRQAQQAVLKARAREVEQRTGKRRKLEFKEGEGRKAVEEMVAPTIKALGVAAEMYKRELDAQIQESATAGA